MFVDSVKLHVKAGNGGDGRVSFRHEKFINKGGPDGGDGGRGGSVILIGDNNLNTLQNFRFKPELIAEDGQSGADRKKHGRNGINLVVKVPVGTQVWRDDKVVADIDSEGQKVLIARGGDGGFGNAHFISSTRQAPKFAEKGEPGQEFEVTFELKLIADVGLVGLPNAGKSTFLSVVSAARPAIADYPFTTLTPNLGVATIDEDSLLIADIPGLIEGASQGKGLGDEFLRHVERTKILLHMIDAYSDDVANDYKVITKELKSYKADLTTKHTIIALSKIDGLSKSEIDKKLKVLKKASGAKDLFAFSSLSKIGLKELLRAVNNQVKIRAAEVIEGLGQDVASEDTKTITINAAFDSWLVEYDEKAKSFVVSGDKIEKFARKTDFTSPEAKQRLLNIMQKMHILRELRSQGVTEGQTVWIGKAKNYKIIY